MSPKQTTVDAGAPRPAVDLAPSGARPGLALVLAILSVPGSTIAWDLPAGGLWIGLPLGVGAIALAVRALRAPGRSTGRRMAIAAIVIAALALGQMVVHTIVSALT